jgi:hypothetical protein
LVEAKFGFLKIMEIFKLYRKALLKYYIKNPSLSEDVDYSSTSNRYRVYRKMINGLSDDDILDQIEEVGDYAGKCV